MDLPDLPVAAAWFVVLGLSVAAVIDGRELRVPNWLTLPMALCGLSYWAGAGGSAGLAWSIGGLFAGLLPLLALCLIGGMGEGDAKLFAAVGAWVGPITALWALGISMIVGGVLAVAMILRSKSWRDHWRMTQIIVGEVVSIRNPDQIAERAYARKASMRLLPYGIPLAIGSIGYFAWSGMLM